MTAPTRTGRRHPDRRDLEPWLLAAVAASAAIASGTAGSAAVARNGGDAIVGFLAGTLAGALAVLGLPSVSVRLVARALLAASAGVLVRFGAINGSLVGGSQVILSWLVAAVAVFVLTDRIGTGAARPLGVAAVPEAARASAPEAPPHVADPATTGRVLPARTGRTVLAAAVGVFAVVLVLAPLALPRMSSAASVGEGPRLGGAGTGSTVLRSTDELDMTSRPELTDEVVFRVTTDRPTFWRGETFDVWDGRTWTRSDADRFSMPSREVQASSSDLGARGTDTFTQRVRVEASFSDVIYGAPSMASIEAPQPLAQRRDGTVTTAGTALGRGATYVVTSRRQPLSEAALRGAGGEVPTDILTRYAFPSRITDRVRASALSVAADATTTYDKILALEAWMGGRTEYSLDAPLSPRGVDVVDHFLFESRQGWCEQVASSLVVMARANGIPARLVTGFVPDERDPVTGTYVVRARDAHAWTEVWFPEIGWVAFDPTADVPLAASTENDATWGRWLLDHAVAIVLGTAVLAAVGWSAARLLARVRRQRRDAAHRTSSWAASADRRLLDLGERADRPRAEGETASVYAVALALRYDEPRLAEVGTTIDDTSFSPVPPESSQRERCDHILDGLAAAEPDAVPAGADVGQ